MVFSQILDPVFSPLLGLPPLVGIIIISFIIAVIIVLAYKYMTNQKEMKQMKEKLKEHQKKMKELRNDPKAMMAVQKEAMQLNMKYMTHSLKPTLITFLPIIIIYGWLSAHFGYLPISAGDTFTTTVNFNQGITGNISMINVENSEEFTLNSNSTQQIINNSASWELTANKEGAYLLEYKYKDSEKPYTKPIIITSKREYANPIKKIKNSDIKTISINNKPLKMLNIFGFKLGWIWTYILFSIIFSIILRKLLKVY